MNLECPIKPPSEGKANRTESLGQSYFELTFVKKDGTERSYRLANAENVAELATGIEKAYRENPDSEPDDLFV